MKIKDIFKKHYKEFLNFKKVENKRSNRPDLNAFLLLEELFPGDGDMVCAARHDKIWLDVEYDDIEKLTEAQIIELARCGVVYDGESLFMFA